MPLNLKRANGTALSGAAGSGAQVLENPDALDVPFQLTEAVLEEVQHVVGAGPGPHATGKRVLTVFPSGAVLTKRQYLARVDAVLPVITTATPAAGNRTGTIAYTIVGTGLDNIEDFAYVNDKGTRFGPATKSTNTATNIAGNVAFGAGTENITSLHVRVAGLWYRAKTL